MQLHPTDDEAFLVFRCVGCTASFPGNKSVTPCGPTMAASIVIQLARRWRPGPCGKITNGGQISLQGGRMLVRQRPLPMRGMSQSIHGLALRPSAQPPEAVVRQSTRVRRTWARAQDSRELYTNLASSARCDYEAASELPILNLGACSTLNLHVEHPREHAKVTVKEGC